MRVCPVRLPRGSSIFPLVVRQLFDLSAIVAHDKDLSIGLRACVGIKRLVFESHPAACEHNAFAVGRPSEVRVVALGVGQLRHVLTVRTNREDFKIITKLANECDQITPRRPNREVVVILGEHGNRVVLKVHNAQASPIGAGCSVDDAVAVGRKRGKCVAVWARGDEVKP